MPSPYPTEICRLELVELTEIVGLVPLLIESHVDERERNVIGESPMKLGGRDVRRFCGCKKWEKKENSGEGESDKKGKERNCGTVMIIGGEKFVS